MGFENIGVDFIYGVPGYPNRDVKEELSLFYLSNHFIYHVITLPLKIKRILDI